MSLYCPRCGRVTSICDRECPSPEKKVPVAVPPDELEALRRDALRYRALRSAVKDAEGLDIVTDETIDKVRELVSAGLKDGLAKILSGLDFGKGGAFATGGVITHKEGETIFGGRESFVARSGCAHEWRNVARGRNVLSNYQECAKCGAIQHEKG